MNTFIFYLPAAVFNNFYNCESDSIDFIVSTDIQPTAKDKILIFCAECEYDSPSLSFNVDEVNKCVHVDDVGLTTVIRMSKSNEIK